MQGRYEVFVENIKNLTTINLFYYKQRQMNRRIDTLIKKEGFDNYDDYYNELKANKELLKRFLKHITINVSEFFRNYKQWDQLEKNFLPSIIKKDGVIKIWSAACSTGEEPYTLAMLLLKYLPPSKFKIIATDIDKDALKKAKEGQYSAKSIENIRDIVKREYFTQRDDYFYVTEKIKSCVRFKHHDLLREGYPDNCDIIVCRNVLIYFTQEAKSIIYKKFAEALHDNGILFVGNTEQIVIPAQYGLSTAGTFFYKKMSELV